MSITTSRTPVAAAGGYAYLVNSVAAGDGNLSAADSLIRYYDEAGTPPGWWTGSGLARLGDGEGLEEGSRVTEEQMHALYGLSHDPVTGEILGSEFNVNSRSGFDLTFQVPKSASVLWAVADAGVQAQIVRAHHAAIRETLALFEREVIMTRTGKRGVAQIATHGLVAAAFDHFDSRAGDPHLHTHVLVANRVQGVDGKWRTLDSRAMFKAIVAMSRTHSALFADRLAEYLPVVWESPTARKRELGEVEITGIPRELNDEFSQRRIAIVAARTAAVEAFTRDNGRAPSEREQRRIDYLSWATTRPAKTQGSLAELTNVWRERALKVLVRLGWKPQTGDGRDAAEWVRQLLGVVRDRVPVLRADDLDQRYVEQVAGSVLDVVQAKRSTWTKWNLHSEAAAQLMNLRFATATDRLAAIDRVVQVAAEGSVDLSPPRLAHTPQEFLRVDGSSSFEVKHGNVFTSTAVLAVEDYLISRIRDVGAPFVDQARVAEVLAEPGEPPTALGVDQAVAVEQIATSGRGLDVLVGPAGAGKTTTLGGLLRVWQAEHGLGSVVGLAPSAAAAGVLAGELEITTENTAKWLYEIDRRPKKQAKLSGLRTRQAQAPSPVLAREIARIEADLNRWLLNAGQLVIVDEASLAGTFALERITRQAHQSGAKVVLVGDPAQLSAVEAGGGFSLAVRELGADAPRLRTIHRFTQGWEAEASLLLRTGRTQVLDTYFARGRVHEGAEAQVLDAAYREWQADREAGKVSLLVAGEQATVEMLNARAQADLIAAGVVRAPAVALADGLRVGMGDVIVTRRNDRTIRTGPSSWVKNGDRWHVLEARDDGALFVRRESGGSSVMLPGHYVAEHVELGYAATTHRAQGATVDTAHTLVVGEGLTREAFYVGMTRGRQANHAYVATLTLKDEEHHLGAGDHLHAREVLERVLANSGVALSARETTAVAQEAASSIVRLADEYETIAVAATQQRWVDLITSSPAFDEQTRRAVVDSPGWGSLAASLRRASDAGINIDTAFPAIATAREVGSAQDVAAVLAHRVDAYTTMAAPRRVHRTMVAGLFPAARGITDPDLQRALAEREELITARAHEIVHRGQEQGHAWAVPGSPLSVTVAAYRDRWGVDEADTRPLGGPVGTDYEQRTQHARATRALRGLVSQDSTPSSRTDPDATHRARADHCPRL